MKKLSKTVLVIFSVIILVLGVVINLLMLKWLDYNTAFSMIEKALTTVPSSRIILVITEICMLLAVICIFVDSSDNTESKSKGQDVLMQNDNGKLMISRNTIANLVNSVVKEFPGAREGVTNIQLDNENNVTVLVDLTVTKDVIIKEMTVDMQNKIKEKIKLASDLDVKEVSVRIKDIVE